MPEEEIALIYHSGILQTRTCSKEKVNPMKNNEEGRTLKSRNRDETGRLTLVKVIIDNSQKVVKKKMKLMG